MSCIDTDKKNNHNRNLNLMAFQLTRLPQGLMVVSDTLSHAQTAAVGVWVASGARHEAKHLMGVSHFLEHMAFKGTHKRSAQDIALNLESVGGQMNAYTSRESTAYYMRVLGQDMPLAIDLLGDILQNSLFLKEEMERERQVILQEISDTQDQPDDQVFDHFYGTAFGDSPMGRPILGTPETVASLTDHDLKTYMQDRYRAPHMVVVATGCVDHTHLVDQVSRCFSNLKATKASPPVNAVYKGGLWEMNRDLEQLHILKGYEAPPLGDSTYTTAALFATLLGGGMSSRLFQEVREKRGLVYSIYSFISGFRDCGLLGIYAGTTPDKYQEVQKVIQGELERLAECVSEEEIIRGKTQLKASLMMAWESVPTRAEQLASQVLIYGHPLEESEIIGRIDAVTSEGVLAYGKKILCHPQTLSVLGPLSKVS
jgi:predicted Zn-dependent peptidase